MCSQSRAGAKTSLGWRTRPLTSSLVSPRTLTTSTNTFTVKSFHSIEIELRMRAPACCTYAHAYPRTRREMTSSRSQTGVCGCRGARSCLLCQGEAGKPPRDETASLSLYFCYKCGEACGSECREDPALSPLRACWEPCTSSRILRPAFTQATTPPFEGVTVVKEFVTREEGASIVSAVDTQTWVDSQSGRRKQVRNKLYHVL